MIRQMEPRDYPRVMEIWNACAGRCVAYKPVSERTLGEWVLGNPNFDPAFALVWAEGEEKPGAFILGTAQREFLPGETPLSTPGYITLLLVDEPARGRGAGKALLDALEARFRAVGKRRARVSGVNPINLPWLVPGRAGHDHNNAPGCDVDCAGYGFLLRQGYSDLHREVAMYLNLSDYRWDPAVDAIRARLAAEGVATGRYDPRLGCDFDRMCTAVGSEYWRKVLRDEIMKPQPRPILAATAEGHIVGFTGPVDRQESGRGFFTGICTDPAFERRGIATVLFNMLMREFIQVGAQFSTLFTGVDNHAQRLYRRTGFGVVKTFAILDKEL